jgi:hypothetical protein
MSFDVVVCCCGYQEREYEELRSKRQAINAQLQLLASCSRGAMTVFDLSKHVPRSSLSPTDLKKFWDDGLHFTPAGYDRFGELLHAHLVLNKLIDSASDLKPKPVEERKKESSSKKKSHASEKSKRVDPSLSS